MNGHIYDAVVVGAGLAGLGAAVELHQAGLDTVVLEARDIPGGRVRSIPCADGAIDLGATWFWHNESLLAELCQALNVEVFEQYLKGDALFEPSPGRVQRLRGNPIDVPALRFRHGAQTLTRALTGQLPQGRLHTNSPVTQIDIRDSEFRVWADERKFRARQVLVALPPALAVSNIQFSPGLPPEFAKLASHTAVWMGSMAKGIAVYDRPWWRDSGLAGAAFSYVGPFREFYDHSGINGSPAALFGFAPSYSLHPEASIEQQFIRQLSRIFGLQAANPLQVFTTDWSQQNHTVPHEISQGSTESFGNLMLRQPVTRTLRFASTETAPAFAGHLEGALLAGRQAAREMITLR